VAFRVVAAWMMVTQKAVDANTKPVTVRNFFIVILFISLRMVLYHIFNIFAIAP
jgi:hypothetical protein